MATDRAALLQQAKKRLQVAQALHEFVNPNQGKLPTAQAGGAQQKIMKVAQGVAASPLAHNAAGTGTMAPTAPKPTTMGDGTPTSQHKPVQSQATKDRIAQERQQAYGSYKGRGAQERIDARAKYAQAQGWKTAKLSQLSPRQRQQLVNANLLPGGHHPTLRPSPGPGRVPGVRSPHTPPKSTAPPKMHPHATEQLSTVAAQQMDSDRHLADSYTRAIKDRIKGSRPSTTDHKKRRRRSTATQYSD